MVAITASLVKELRDKTDAPMMECKKALTEAEGDLTRAEELLRVKLGNRATKAASRVAAEGIVVALIEGKVGALLELNCETDFVAKNEDFLALAKNAVSLVVKNNPKDVESLMGMPVDGATIDEIRRAAIGKIGENIAIRRFVRYDTSGQLASYLHGNKIGVLVDYVGGSEQVGRDLAMHIAAAKPLCVSRDQVPAEKIEQERKIFAAQAAESGKPAEIVAKMVDGQINKYLATVALLGQPFVKNLDETV
jgi:elongation factor Ts